MLTGGVWGLSLQIFNEDIVEELVTGFTYSTSLVKGKVLQSADTSTFCSKVRASPGGSKIRMTPRLHSGAQEKTQFVDSSRDPNGIPYTDPQCHLHRNLDLIFSLQLQKQKENTCCNSCLLYTSPSPRD